MGNITYSIFDRDIEKTDEMLNKVKAYEIERRFVKWNELNHDIDEYTGF